MASGRTHVASTIALTPMAAMIAWQLAGGETTAAMLAGAGCLSGVLISPDLDMTGRTISETILLRWNMIVGKLWIAIWFPYAFMSKHRGLSHVPIFGTISRVLYMAALYVGIHYILQYYYPLDLLQWPIIYQEELLIFVAGLAISDVGHWVLDGCKF